MEHQDFEDFAREQVGRRGRIPLSGSFELTGRCNLRCVHCYLCDYRAEPELTTEEVLRILDELAAAGCLRLLVTGGEPLLRPDFERIWRHAVGRGFLLTLFTNATLADARLAGFLRAHPPVLCEVTLYGASRSTYRRVCGNAEAFDAALAGLDRLRAALPQVGVKCMALRENADDVDALAELARARGLDFNFDTDVFPRLDRDPAPLLHAFEPEEGVRRVLDSRLHRRTWAAQAAEPPPRPLRRAGRVVVCRAGECSFHVGPYGDLCLCMLLREPAWSLRRGSFQEGWETVLEGLRQRERATPSRCLECPALQFCTPCAGRNLLETGDWEEPAPQLCRRSFAVAGLVQERQGIPPSPED